MSRADLEAAAEEKYPVEWASDDHTASALADMRAGYVQGRLDQAEADARIAEGRHDVGWEGRPIMTALYPCDGQSIAAAIRKGVQ